MEPYEIAHFRKLYNESLEITRKLGDQRGIGESLNKMAVIFLGKDAFEESLFHVLQAYKILEGRGLPQELRLTYWTLLKLN
jgi:hypothetical protein